MKRYGEVIAVDHLNLTIREGEIFGLLGPNGCGKTTTINCLLSLLSYDKGDIEIFGEEITPTNYKLKSQIGVVMQNVAVFDELTVSENIDYFKSKYPNIKIKIYTKTISKQLKLDFEKYQKQYKNIEINEFKNSHDRFLIIDKKEVYHLGASLKDLGKKWFAFSKFEIENLKILDYRCLHRARWQ